MTHVDSTQFDETHTFQADHQLVGPDQWRFYQFKVHQTDYQVCEGRGCCRVLLLLRKEVVPPVGGGSALKSEAMGADAGAGLGVQLAGCLCMHCKSGTLALCCPALAAGCGGCGGGGCKG